MVGCLRRRRDEVTNYVRFDIRCSYMVWSLETNRADSLYSRQIECTWWPWISDPARFHRLADRRGLILVVTHLLADGSGSVCLVLERQTWQWVGFRNLIAGRLTSAVIMSARIYIILKFWQNLYFLCSTTFSFESFFFFWLRFSSPGRTIFSRRFWILCRSEESGQEIQGNRKSWLNLFFVMFDFYTFCSFIM